MKFVNNNLVFREGKVIVRILPFKYYSIIIYYKNGKEKST